MKKILSIIMVLAVFLSLSVTAFAEVPNRVVVGGEEIETDVDPIIVEGRIMLPVRALFEAIGAKVSYDAAERKVTAVKDDITVTFVIDSNIMTINGETKEIDVPATILENRTLAPLRACAEAFDLDVSWDQDYRIARVKIPVSVLSEEYSSLSYSSTIYTYDSHGNRIKEETPKYNTSIVHTYDEKDFLIYTEKSDGVWYKYTYNQYGNLTLREVSTGSWEKHEYDENGNQTLHENSYGMWNRYTHDSNGNIISIEDHLGTKTEYSYENNKLVYIKDGTGHWEKRSYDNNGNMIYCENSASGWTKYTYDENGNLIYAQDSYGNYASVTYDENGNVIYQQSSNGEWKKFEYNEQGNLVKETNSDGTWTKYDYDENGYLIYQENSDGDWEKYKVVVK